MNFVVICDIAYPITSINRCPRGQVVSSFAKLTKSENVQVIAKISVTSSIVINMPTRELSAGETKSSFV